MCTHNQWTVCTHNPRGPNCRAEKRFAHRRSVPAEQQVLITSVVADVFLQREYASCTAQTPTLQHASSSAVYPRHSCTPISQCHSKPSDGHLIKTQTEQVERTHSSSACLHIVQRCARYRSLRRGRHAPGAGVKGTWRRELGPG